MSKKANSKSQKLFPFAKMIENHGGVSIYLTAPDLKMVIFIFANTVDSDSASYNNQLCLDLHYLHSSRLILSMMELEKKASKFVIYFLTQKTLVVCTSIGLKCSCGEMQFCDHCLFSMSA